MLQQAYLQHLHFHQMLLADKLLSNTYDQQFYHYVKDCLKFWLKLVTFEKSYKKQAFGKNFFRNM